jgi:chromosome partitioning protein
MIVVSLVGTKGGSGKSTLTCNLAVAAKLAAAEEGRPDARIGILDSDPQHTLAMWMDLRKSQVSLPEVSVYADADSVADGVDALRLNEGLEVCFVDTPPNLLRRVRETVRVSHVAIIPVKPSLFDLHATRDCIAICEEEGRTYRVAINDVHSGEKFADEVREYLVAEGIPMLDSEIRHRAVYVSSIRTGQAGGEVQGAHVARKEMSKMWAEIAALAKGAAHG